MSTRSPSDVGRAWRARLAFLAVAAGLLTRAPQARATPPSPATPAEASASNAPAASPDPMEPLRERFRAGVEQYRAGRYADAILIWEQIYRELGPEGGYRLSFNLGRAYDAASDLTKAAEHYETYVTQVVRRRAAGDALEAQVEKQDRDARERLAQLAASRGRIRVLPGERPTAAQIDNGEPRLAGFVAYVAPGAHAITFGAGTGRARVEVTVVEGQVVEVAPVEAPAPPVVVGGAPARDDVIPRGASSRTPPFSATWIYVAGGITLASAVVPLVGYARALGTKSDYDQSVDRGAQQRLAADYADQRRFAYVSLGVTGVLTAVTAGLGAAWLWWPTSRGAARTGIAAVPMGEIGRGGTTVGLAGRF
jgi:hypothetical protein